MEIPQTGPNPVPVQPAGLTVLMGDDARRSADLLGWTMPDGKRFWIKAWHSSGQFFAWQVQVDAAGDYDVALLVNAPAGTELELRSAAGSLTCALARDGWDRFVSPTPLPLPAGRSEITLRLCQPAEAEFKSLELTPASAREEIQQRVNAFRASARWMREAQYGVMVQYGDWGYPRHGTARKGFPRLYEEFDVEAFADLVQRMGAGWVIWSLTWRGSRFAIPLHSVERILPGHTTRRDLIADLIGALGRRGIRLMLYYHPGHEDLPWWARNWVSIYDKRLLLDNMVAVLGEIGRRYGDGLAGWFLDDGMLLYPLDFERLGGALKAGSRERLVSVNPWILPRLTEFQDVTMGEDSAGNGETALGGDGQYTAGPHKGLYAHGMFRLDNPDWGIWQPDTEITINYEAPQLIELIRGASSRGQALSLNFLMYEDVTVHPQVLSMMQTVRRTIRGV